MPKGKSQIDVETFVVTWSSKENILQVATALGCSVSNVRGRANRLRKKGVKLREFPSMGGGRHLDVARLNKLAADALAKACEQPIKRSAAR